jgi:hypothetical protein
VGKVELAMSVDDRLRTAMQAVKDATVYLDAAHGQDELYRRQCRTTLRTQVAVALLALAVVVSGFLVSIGVFTPTELTVSSPLFPTATSPPSTTRPLAPIAGNLVDNWSFEQDLSGWQVLGTANAHRSAPGRTSGWCAVIQASGTKAEDIGLALPRVVRSAARGTRFEGVVWVKSTTPGVTVALELRGGKPGGSTMGWDDEVSAMRWHRLTVDHTLIEGDRVDLRVVARNMPVGSALLVDNVVVKKKR